jgi:FkbM family methyltransferase
MLSQWVRLMGRGARAAYRHLFPSPEVAAWRQARERARSVPRYTPGSIRMLDYQLQYADLLSFCPEWHDIFVDGALEYRADAAAPRILDCGANVGLASLFFKLRCPSARITAYEADPTLFRILRGNLDANRASDVETIHAALWTADGRVTFQADGSESGMIGSLAGAIGGTAVDVPSLRLRDVIERDANGCIDLLKLDIEGAEDAVLADCEPALGRVRAMVLDLHEFDPCHRQAPRVLELLTRVGFTYAVDEFVPQPWRPPVSLPNTPFPGKALVWSMTVRAWRQ